MGMTEEIEIMWQGFLHYLQEWAKAGAEGLPETFDQWTDRVYGGSRKQQKTA